MRNIKSLFNKRTIEKQKLIKYGFQEKQDKYYLEKDILNGSFVVCVEISEEAKTAKVIEKDFKEEYALVDVEDAAGEFVR